MDPIINIVSELEPTPTKFWGMLCTMGSDELRMGILRETVREYLDGLGVNKDGDIVNSVALELHDRLCIMGYRETLKLQAQIDEKRASGELKNEVDKTRKEAEDMFSKRSNSVPPTPESIRATFADIDKGGPSTFSYKG